jgi:hypothetical protein
MVKFTRMSQSDKLTSAGQKAQTSSQRKSGDTPKDMKSSKRQSSVAPTESAYISGKLDSKTELEREIERKIKKIEKFANLEGI